MTTLKSIETFLSQKNLAVAGVSAKKQKFGNFIYKELVKKGYNVSPVNINLKEYDGKKCYNNLASLPNDVTGLVICTKPDKAESLIVEAEKKGINNIWLQQGSADKKLLDVIEKSQSNIISKECIIMFAEPAKGIHRFHRWIKKSFGRMYD